MTLIDLGLDDLFDTSMTFIQATIQNINAGQSAPIADISFIRSRDFETIFSTMLSPCDVLHVMAHGAASAYPTFQSTDEKTKFDLVNLSHKAQASGNGIRAHTILADACSTASGKWQRAIRASLEGDITYIGTTREITWHDSTVFCAAFYGALFKKKGKGESSAAHSFDSAQRAIKAFESITAAKCPFRAVTLAPSPMAMRRVVDQPKHPKS